MMNYNPMGQPNPYMYNQHPNYFTNAMLQTYQPQQQNQQQNQQSITTQPPILQPQGNKMIQVSNKEEATGASVDLIYGTPSFFYNKSNGEIYLKQFDVANGNAIFKVYGEIPQSVEEKTTIVENNTYDKEFEYLKQGIAGLYRKLEQLPIYVKEDEEIIEIEQPKQQKGKKNA